MPRQIENTQPVVITAETVFGDVNRQIFQLAKPVNKPLRIEFLQIKIPVDRTDSLTFMPRRNRFTGGNEMAGVVVDCSEIARTFQLRNLHCVAVRKQNLARPNGMIEKAVHHPVTDTGPRDIELIIRI